MSGVENSKEAISKNRRVLLQAAGAAALVGSSPFISSSSWAGSDLPEKIGTFPKGVAGDSVFVGLVSPLTGPFSATGIDLKNGYDLALTHLNEGAGMAAMFESLGGNKGLLGKTIKWKIGDTETKAQVAVQLATKFILDNKAIMIGGGTASSTSVALEKLAQREKVLNMVGVSGANETTGVDCQRYGFRSQPSAFMAGKALAPILKKELGEKRKVAYLTPDYNYGHSVEQSTRRFTEAEDMGWEMVERQVCPVGTTDFAPYLINIANSKADVFVNVTFGDDSTISSKQAKAFGIQDKMVMVVPNISPFQAKEAGADVMAGVYGTMSFWWGMAQNNKYAEVFVQTFEERFKYKPRWCAHVAYLQIMLWADAVTRAETFNPVAVIKMLESGNKIETSLGEVYYRECDHQLVRAVPVLRGKAPDEMNDPEDFYEIVGMTEGELTMPECSETLCKMPEYL